MFVTTTPCAAWLCMANNGQITHTSLSSLDYTREEMDILDHAINIYGFLLNDWERRNTQISFEQFAQFIEEYQEISPRQAVITQLLRRVRTS
jgi:hypothetical protein